MQKTARELRVAVGEAKCPITLTDSAVEAVQEEAAGKAVTAFADIWSIIEDVEQGEGFSSVELNALLELRDYVQGAREVIDVLIECRPLDELGSDED